MSTILPITHQNDGVQSINSLQISELVQSRHDSVKRTIERLVQQEVIVQPPMVNGEKSANNVITQVYLFQGKQGRLDSITVVAQLCPQFTARLVKRWDELENSQHALLDKVDNDTAWLIDELQDEVLRTQPELLKLITYRKMGLSQREIALLLGVSDTTVRYRLLKLARLGFIDYTPNEKYQQMGRLGYQAKQAKQLTLGV